MNNTTICTNDRFLFWGAVVAMEVNQLGSVECVEVTQVYIYLLIPMVVLLQ
jgi:hypothetical protein